MVRERGGGGGERGGGVLVRGRNISSEKVRRVCLRERERKRGGTKREEGECDCEVERWGKMGREKERDCMTSSSVYFGLL